MKGSGHLKLSRDGSGNVDLIVEEEEDLWNLFNLVNEGDKIRARTTRKVKLENASGDIKVEVKKIVITIEVTKVEYEPTDTTIRFSGKNSTEHEDIRMGQFHTIEIGLNYQLSLYKDCWDFLDRERLLIAINPKKTAETAAILMESGTAKIYLLTQSLVKELASVSVTMPKQKMYGKTDKAKIKFFQMIYGSMKTHLNFEILRCILLGGPDDLKQEFFDWLMAAASQRNEKEVLQKKGIFSIVNVSGIGKVALGEALKSEAVQKKIGDVQSVSEAQCLSKYHKLAQDEPLRACYGVGPVACASQNGAIQTLMMLDTIFRSCVVAHRQYYASMASNVKDGGGNVVVMSPKGICGEELRKLGSIAAILRYPLYELEDLAPDYIPDELK